MAQWSKPVIFEGYKFQALISGLPFCKSTASDHVSDCVCLDRAPKDVIDRFKNKFIGMNFVDWCDFAEKNLAKKLLVPAVLADC